MKILTYSKDIDSLIALENWEELQKVLESVIRYHKANLLPHYEKMEKYFNAETAILDRSKEDPTLPNNKAVNDYAGLITTVGAGYFIGAPVKYTVKDEYKDQLAEIQEVLDANDEQVENLYLAMEAGHKGATFELVYQDEQAQTRFKELDAKQTVMIYDDKLEAKPLFAIRYFESNDIMEKANSELLNVEIYTAIYKVMLQLESYKIKAGIEIDENPFNEVPVIEYLNNKYRKGDFENVITLIDAYDKTISDSMNDIEYFSDAYLVLKNLGGTEEEDIQDMKKSRVIYIENDGDARFLLKQGDAAPIENHKKTLNDNIHKFSHTPDLRDENFANNVSGVAMKYKLWGLEQKTTFKEAAFKKALQKRLRLIGQVINAKKADSKAFDTSWIQISFTRSIPENWDELLKMVQGLRGMLSDQSILSYLPNVTDVDYEIEMREKERDNMGFKVDPYNVTKLPLE